MNTVSEEIYGAFVQEIDCDDEPPLNDDEIRGIEIADREIAEGKVIPFSQVFKDLCQAFACWRLARDYVGEYARTSHHNKIC